MGAALVDYAFADAEIAPDRLREAIYGEQVVRMPDSWVATDAAQSIAEVTSRRDNEGLPPIGFVFSSFNTHYKITPRYSTPGCACSLRSRGSVLWLRHDNDDMRNNLRVSAERRGISPERLIFARRIGLADHLARHRLADLFLDAFPYGAQTTASRALWAGLPVLTRHGETWVSRVSASILLAAGLPELVVDSLDDYEARALDLARDPDRLANRRRKLAGLRTTPPLFDSERYRRHVEQAHVQMFDRWRRSEPAVSFDVVAVDWRRCAQVPSTIGGRLLRREGRWTCTRAPRRGGVSAPRPAGRSASSANESRSAAGPVRSEERRAP